MQSGEQVDVITSNNNSATNNTSYIFSYEDDDDDDERSYDTDEEDEEDEDFQPTLERVLQPAVIPLTCNRCRQTIQIVTRTNPSFRKASVMMNRTNRTTTTLWNAASAPTSPSSPPLKHSNSKSSLLLSKSDSAATNNRSQTLRGVSAANNLSNPSSPISPATMDRTLSVPDIQRSMDHKKSFMVHLPYQLITQDEYLATTDYVFQKLFHYASTKAHVDNELCVECMELIIAEKEREWTAAHYEAECYQNYVNKRIPQSFVTSSLLDQKCNHTQPENDANAGSETHNDAEDRREEHLTTDHESDSQEDDCTIVETQMEEYDDDSSLTREEQMLLHHLQELEAEENEWKLRITQLQEEETELESIEASMKEEETKLNTMEQEYWSQYNDFQYRLNSFQQERDSLQQNILSVSRTLDRLNATNALNDSFYIWYEGHFGTINNFRLGRLPTQTVEWNEINAAWGQAVLLLSCLAKKVNYTFKQARIVSLGSFSKVEVKRLSGWNSYELYGGHGGLFWQSKFDKAQIAFMACIKELTEHCQSQAKSGTNNQNRQQTGGEYHREMPYPINGEQVGGLSVKWGDDERWTKACKYLLTDLKWLIGVICFEDRQSNSTTPLQNSIN